MVEKRNVSHNKIHIPLSMDFVVYLLYSVLKLVSYWEFYFSASRSRSPPVRERMVDREERRPRSPRYSISPDAKKGTTAPKSRRRSPTPDGNGKRVENWSPDNNDGLVKGRDEKSPSPGSPERLRASPDMNASPFDGNGYSRSPSPREGKSPADDDVVEDRRTPRGSESP